MNLLQNFHLAVIKYFAVSVARSLCRRLLLVAITHMMTSRQRVNESARVRIVNVSIHTLNVHHTLDLKDTA